MRRTDSFSEVLKLIDPHLSRWMLFVDGENFTLRAQKIAEERGITMEQGKYYIPNVFVWIPALKPTEPLTNMSDVPLRGQSHAIRSYYYTSTVGDTNRIISIRQTLWELGFHPEVFKKEEGKKAKGVGIALTKDLLSHAFLNNYDIAVLIAGDGGYIPLIEEVKRLGKVIYVAFFTGPGLNSELQLKSDTFFGMNDFFLKRWEKFNNEEESSITT